MWRTSKLAATSYLIGLLLTLVTPSLRASDAELWQAVQIPGHYVVMRHAKAPGVGDPPGFTLADCSTQRNLDEAGRNQARAIGDAFRAKGIHDAKVFSSQWCRCTDTARLLELGEVTELLPLNSFFESRSDAATSIRGMRAFMRDHTWSKPVVMVTHQVNITGLTGIYPASGEMVVVKLDEKDDVAVVGRLMPFTLPL